MQIHTRSKAVWTLLWTMPLRQTSMKGDFSVDGSGSITVNNEPDFEADLRPAFIVRVDDANGDLLGLISVRVTITDVDEDPVITPIPAGDVPWVYENFQISDAVVTKVSTQDAGRG